MYKALNTGPVTGEGLQTEQFYKYKCALSSAPETSHLSRGVPCIDQKLGQSPAGSAMPGLGINFFSILASS